MKSTLTWKVALLLIVPSCGAFATFGLFWSFHVQSDPASINAAGRQPLLAVELGAWADMVASGQDEDRPGLRERVAAFDGALTVLEQGGEIEGDTLEPPPERAALPLAGVRAVWSELRPRLRVIAASPAASPALERAHRGLGPAIEALRMRSTEVTEALESEVRAARVRVLRILGAMAGASLALVVLGLWYARRFVVRPILRIDAAARRIHDGDLTARADVPSGNELSSLARTFNEMAARVEHLLVALDLRRRHAEVLTDNMPIGTALLDENLVIIRSSHSFQELFQLTEAEVRGRLVTEILPAGELPNQLRAVMETGEAARGLRYDEAAPDGTTRRLRVNAAATRLEDGEQEGARLVLVVEDLTEEERLRAAAHAAEARLTRLVAASPAMIYARGASGDDDATYISPNILEQLGYEPSAFLERSTFWTDHIHPEDEARVVAEEEALFEHGHRAVEYRFRHADGSYRWMRDEMRLARDEAGDPTEIVGSWMDITKRKKVEEQHQLLLRAIEQSGHSVVITNARGDVEYVNPQFTRSTGYAPEEIMGKNSRLLSSGETPPEAYAGLWRTILSGRTWQGTFRNKKKDGGLYTESATISPVLSPAGVVTHFVAVKEDITEQQRAEKELELFRALLDRSNDGIEVIDAETGRFLDINQRGCLDLGYTREEFLSMSVSDVDPMVDASTFREVLGEIRRSGSMVWEGHHRRKDGSTFPVEVNLAYVELDQPYLVSVVRDITERKRAEQIRREDEERYRTLFDNAPIGLGVVDAKGTILAFNTAMIAPSGYTPEEAADLGNVAALYANPNDRARVSEMLRERGRVDREEVDFKRKDGSHFANLLTLRPVVVRGQPCVLAMMEDISDRKALEAQMHAAQKMDALGRLAGGVAHDFNNLLTVIISYAGFVRDELRREDPRRDDIAEVLRAADSAASLTQHLLVFSRRTAVEPAVTDLNELVLELDKMLRRLIGEDVELVLLPGSDLWCARVDPRQIEQVVVNLAVNARDAMPTGGTLTIGLDNAAIADADRAQVPLLPPGEYVRLVVKDTGCGMDEATQDKAFEPFFTTKEPGKGTGLGLATSYGIIKQFGGHVHVDSALGKGTTFKVYFPRSQGDPTTRKSGSAPKVKLEGSETVLVVEDQRAVRNLAVRALRAWGYRVLEAQNGEAAMAVLREHGDSIDLLLTDVVMPKISGTELAQRFRESRPGAKVLLMSGYTDEEANRHGVLESGHAFLQKPFLPNALVLRVREILDAA